jgi:hypothetical protein
MTPKTHLAISTGALIRLTANASGLTPRSMKVSPPAKARCLLQPVLLYLLHERDA